jgi:hypothetical protein
MKNFLASFLVHVLALYRRLMENSVVTMAVLFIPGFERMRWNIGRMKAMKEHRRASKDVPAYIDLVKRICVTALN